MGTNVVLLSSEGDDMYIFRRSAPEGPEVSWVDQSQPLEQLVARCRDAVAIITTGEGIPMDLAKACPNLKLVQSIGAGTDELDVAALNGLGVRVANNGGANAAAVAEHTVALMVAVYRKLQLQLQWVKTGQWAGPLVSDWYLQAHDLTGKTVGILGLGIIGRQVARRLQGWDCSLIYTRARDIASELERELPIRRVSRDELLAQSDIVTILVPLTRSTLGMISKREFSMMKPTAILINTSRGQVVDERALVTALRESRLAGAGLDVLEQEPPAPDNPLLSMDNVLVTPHWADFTREAYERCWAFAMRNAIRVANGEEPQSVVAPP